MQWLDIVQREKGLQFSPSRRCCKIATFFPSESIYLFLWGRPPHPCLLTEFSMHAVEGDPPQIDFLVSPNYHTQFYHYPNVFLRLLPSYNLALFPLLSF